MEIIALREYVKKAAAHSQVRQGKAQILSTAAVSQSC